MKRRITSVHWTAEQLLQAVQQPHATTESSSNGLENPARFRTLPPQFFII